MGGAGWLGVMVTGAFVGPNGSWREGIAEVVVCVKSSVGVTMPSWVGLPGIAARSAAGAFIVSSSSSATESMSRV